MKQAYEAPRLEVVQYSLHEAIAANCSDKVYNLSLIHISRCTAMQTQICAKRGQRCA